MVIHAATPPCPRWLLRGHRSRLSSADDFTTLPPCLRRCYRAHSLQRVHGGGEACRLAVNQCMRVRYAVGNSLDAWFALRR